MSSKKRAIENNITGIILAGGNSSRFQKKNNPWQDKALFKLSDLSLLEKNIQLLSEICNEIIISVNNIDRKYQYTKIINKYQREELVIKAVIDDHSYLCTGPSLGIISSLEAANNKIGIIIPVDLPNLTKPILLEMISSLGDASIAVPYWTSKGKIEPLVCVLDITLAKEYCTPLKYIVKSRADDLIRILPTSKFLAITLDNELNGDVIFSSLNTRKNLQETKVPVVSYKHKFFSLKKSVIKHNSLTLKEVKKISSILSNLDFNFKKIDFENLSNLILNLQKKKVYFPVGILLTQVLTFYSQFSIENHVDKIIENYCSEAKDWENLYLNLLALHAYSDAYKIALQYKKNKIDLITTKINQLRELMNLKKKEHNNNSYEEMLQKRFPKLLEEIHILLQEAEISFNREEPIFETDFLWDHSYRVSKIAYKLAILEGLNPLIPTLAGLLHDAGKFILGKYHKGKTTEEKYSAEIAESLLSKYTLSSEEISQITSSIIALYSENINCSINCQIVHDADRLEKLGSLGIANYYSKMALRGQNLSQSILRNLSRELTYAINAKKTLFTKSAQRLAELRSKATINHFKDLLADLEIYDMGSYLIKEYNVLTDIKLILVIPTSCHKCSGNFEISLDTEQGIKCKKLVATYRCINCKNEHLVSFCLPLLLKD